MFPRSKFNDHERFDQNNIQLWWIDLAISTELASCWFQPGRPQALRHDHAVLVVIDKLSV